MLILGIDPGLAGAACAYFCADDDGPEFISDAIDLPVMEDGTKNQLDTAKFCAWLRCLPEWPVKAFIENVQPMPSIPGAGGVRRSMGAASSFRFGMAVGQIRGAIDALGIRRQMVHPQVWKRHFDLKGADKESARQMAIGLFPHAAHLLKRKKDHQRAEAMLIAKWGNAPFRRNSV